MKRVSNRGKNKKDSRIKNRYVAERPRHFLFIGLQDRADGGDGAAAANCRARRNQKRRIAAHLQEFAERQARQKRKENSQRGVDKSATARFQNLAQIHAEPEGHHGALEKSSRNAAALIDVGMREAEAKENSDGKRDRRRKQSRERKCETRNKNNFRESGHRLEKEYQAKGVQSQRVRAYSRSFSGDVEAGGCDGTGAFAGARGVADLDFAGVGCARLATILAVAALLIWQLRS